MKNPVLHDNAERFIRYKHSMGYSYVLEEYNLNRYIVYADEHCQDLSVPGNEDVNAFLATLSGKPFSLCNTACVLMEFGRFLIMGGDTSAYVLPPKRTTKPEPEPPYFFLETEITAFFSECDAMKAYPHLKGREIVMPALFRLLYCCGVRCQEARTLKCCDVHLEENYIDILLSKGPKSRRLYITDELSEYLQSYDGKIRLLFPEREYFFPYRDGYYGPGAISGTFNRVWHATFPDFIRNKRPRAYDFRHHFAYANINRWVAEGKDINAMIPYLVRYMGHKTLDETLYYFHFVPDFFPEYRKISSSLEAIIPEVDDE